MNSQFFLENIFLIVQQNRYIMKKKYVYFNDAKVDENVFMHNLIPNF